MAPILYKQNYCQVLHSRAWGSLSQSTLRYLVTCLWSLLPTPKPIFMLDLSHQVDINLSRESQRAPRLWVAFLLVKATGSRWTGGPTVGCPLPCMALVYFENRMLLWYHRCIRGVSRKGLFKSVCTACYWQLCASVSTFGLDQMRKHSHKK